MRFTPHVTVATIVEDNGRFLMVEELADGQAVFNQPAGHLEADESLIQAALRETLEETGWDVELTSRFETLKLGSFEGHHLFIHQRKVSGRPSHLG